ncbi:hypothetical protein V6N13_047704 [Hibiscus sabdariffa]
MSPPNMLKIGPVRYDYDNLGIFWCEKGNDRISEIYISHTHSAIASLQFQYFTPSGEYVLSKLYGTCNEFIIGVEGMLEPVNGIRSLTFVTNKRKFGPFGFNGVGGSGSGMDCSKLAPFDLHFGLSRRFGGFNGIVKSGQISSIGGYLKI